MKIKDISLGAIMIALVAMVSIFVAVPAGNIGYINLGDCVILLSAYFLSPSLMFMIGGLGSLIADLALGYTQYAAVSFVVKGLEGFLVARLVKKNQKSYLYLCLLGVGLMAVGYACVDLFMFQSWGIFLDSLLLNYAQGITAVVCAAFILPLIKNRLSRNEDVGQ